MAQKRVAGENAEYKKGEQGIALLTCLDGNRVKIKFESTGNEFNLELGSGEDRNVPEYVPYRPPETVDGNIKFYTAKVSCTMNENGTKVLFMSPANGEYQAHFLKFAAPEGQQPVPVTKIGKKGRQYRSFTAVVELRGNPRWNGATKVASLYPNFGKDEDGTLCVSGEGSGSDTLDDFLTVIGLLPGELKYSENPLPDIQKLANAKDKNFKIIISKGWIDKFVEILDEEDWETPVLTEENKSTDETKEYLHELLED